MDLKDWQLAIETRTDATHQHARLTLKSISLPPKQTVILVTGWSKNSHTLPTEKIYDLSKAHREMLGPKHLKNTLIGRDGFFLQLLHPTGRVVDTCGTLDGESTDRRDLYRHGRYPIARHPKATGFSLLRRFDGDVAKRHRNFRMAAGSEGRYRHRRLLRTSERYFRHPAPCTRSYPARVQRMP